MSDLCTCGGTIWHYCITLQVRDRCVEELQAEVQDKNSQIVAKDDLITRKDREIATKETQLQVQKACTY